MALSVLLLDDEYRSSAVWAGAQICYFHALLWNTLVKEQAHVTVQTRGVSRWQVMRKWEKKCRKPLDRDRSSLIGTGSCIWYKWKKKDSNGKACLSLPGVWTAWTLTCICWLRTAASVALNGAALFKDLSAVLLCRVGLVGVSCPLVLPRAQFVSLKQVPWDTQQSVGCGRGNKVLDRVRCCHWMSGGEKLYLSAATVSL